MRESLRIDSLFMGAGMPKAYSRDLRERVGIGYQEQVSNHSKLLR
jgi:hypothetical protein